MHSDYKKTIAITFAEDVIARNILFTDFWPTFLEGVRDLRIVALVQPDRVDYYRELLAKDGILVEGYKRSRPDRFENAVASLARSGINTHSNLWSKMRSYYRGDTPLLSTLIKILHQYTLGNFGWYKNFLRYLFLKTGKDDARAEEIFKTYTPDLLIALSLTNYDFDVTLARYAKAQGVRVLGMVRSWDNFSSHGLLRVAPDRFVLQNDFLKEMAITHQALSEKRIPMSIIGLPHYDQVYQYESILRPREEFLKGLGLDPSKKVIFYGAMGDFLFIHEGELPKIFDSLIESRELGDDAQFLYRAHPKFKVNPSIADGLRHVVLDAEGSYVDLDSKNITLNQNEYLINALYHSDVVTTGASTIAIDAALMDKPVVCVAFDGNTSYDDVRYFESVRRFYDLYTHFEALVDTGGVQIAYNTSEFVEKIHQYRKNPGQDRGGRSKILERFVAPFDGKASKRLAEVFIDDIIKLT